MTKITLIHLYTFFKSILSSIIIILFVDKIDLATSLSVHCFGSEKLLLLLPFPGMSCFSQQQVEVCDVLPISVFIVRIALEGERSTALHKGYSP